MRRIPFTTESYQHPSLPVSAKQLLNLYVEQAPDDARSQAVLMSTPGTVPYLTLGAGPIQAENSDLPGRWYFVSGTHFFRVSFLPTGRVIDDLGDIGTPVAGEIPDYDLFYTIAVSPTAVVVCVPPNAFTASHTPGDPINQIGGTFPGASNVTQNDLYFVFTSYSSNPNFFISRINDPTMFDALDFANSDAVPNNLRTVVGHRGDLWLMGNAGVEVWYDSGDLNFPYRRRPGGVIPHGVATAPSVATGDGSVFWVGADDIIYRSDGYHAKRISTHAIEVAVTRATGARPGAFNLVTAFTYIRDGHTFYCLNLPDTSLIYDCATDKWHERASAADGSGHWRPRGIVHVLDEVFFTDSQSNQIAQLYPDAPTEFSALLLRQVILPPLWAGTNRAFCHRLEIEMETGGAATMQAGDVLLDWSDDGGWTWTGGPRTMSVGTVGQRRKRVFTTRLGSFRQRVFRITATGWVTLYGVDAYITGGAS
jgi:hypothetical protein